MITIIMKSNIVCLVVVALIFSVSCALISCLIGFIIYNIAVSSGNSNIPVNKTCTNEKIFKTIDGELLLKYCDDACANHTTPSCKSIFSEFSYCDLLNTTIYENDIDINKCNSSVTNTMKICAFKYYNNSDIANIRAYVRSYTCGVPTFTRLYCENSCEHLVHGGWFNKNGFNITTNVYHNMGTLTQLRVIQNTCLQFLNMPAFGNMYSQCPPYLPPRCNGEIKNYITQLPIDYSFLVAY